MQNRGRYLRPDRHDTAIAFWTTAVATMEEIWDLWPGRDARAKRRWCLKIAVGLLFATIPYGFAYTQLVVPYSVGGSCPDPSVKPCHYYCIPTYDYLYRLPCGETLSEYFFAPANWVDRRVRPDIWEGKFMTNRDWSNVIWLNKSGTDPMKYMRALR